MAIAAAGTRIQINGSTITELTEINGVALTQETIDVTNLSSPDRAREFLAGFIDGGEVSISGFFNPSDTTGQIAVRSACTSGSLSAFVILLPSGAATQNFNGIITNFETSVGLEDAISFSATIKVSGLPTLGIGASAGITALSVTATGGTLTPAFNASNRTYAYSGITGTSATVTVTAVNHTIQLFVDGSLFQTVSSGGASNAISLPAIGGKELTIVVFEANKASLVYTVALIKTA